MVLPTIDYVKNFRELSKTESIEVDVGMRKTVFLEWGRLANDKDLHMR